MKQYPQKTSQIPLLLLLWLDSDPAQANMTYRKSGLIGPKSYGSYVYI